MTSIRRSPLVAILSAVALVAASLVAATSEASAAPTVYTVNSTGNASDSSQGDGTCRTANTIIGGAPECTLRAAIQEANASTDLDTIEFAIPTTDSGYEASPLAFRLRPTSWLPNITRPVILDASTQPQYSTEGRPVVVIDGVDAPTSGDSNGLTLQAGNSTIRGLVVQRFGDDGMEVETGGGNLIVGNYFGTDVTGTYAVPNATNGVTPVGGITIKSSNNVIGGPLPADANVLSGNNGNGIVFRSGASDNVLIGNYIGTDRFGTGAIPNASSGVGLEDSGTKNRIGGPSAGEGNRIAFNSGPGIGFSDSTRLNPLLGNSISDNSGLGIDFGAVGVTANDGGDIDSGANDLQNHPVISAAVESSGTVTVDFDLDATAGTYRIEAFTNPSGLDPTGYGEGEVFEAASTIVHAGGGAQAFQMTYPGQGGDSLTLTATGPEAGADAGSTSEFSLAHTVVSNIVTVNSTGDVSDSTPGDDRCDTGGTVGSASECTLRAAIEEANASALVDTVRFEIPTSDSGHATGVWTIAPPSDLPDLDTPVTIDGSTQPGFASVPVIELDGSATGSGDDGLRVFGDDVTIRSLAINRFGADGIEVQATAERTLIVGNHVGVSPSGLLPEPNGERGIELQAGSGPSTIGGVAAADRNVVSANLDDGVVIYGSNDNVVIGNFIGTDITGNSPLPNGSDGVWVASGAADNRIGQTGAGNVISGNGEDGIEIADVTGGTIIEANMIGLGADGDTIMANGRHGVVLYNGANTTQVGNAGAGNVISGNTRHGVHINANSDLATMGNSIRGNLIGTDATGMFDRGNGSNGVELVGNAQSTTIGGAGAGEGNVISGNGGNGIWVSWAEEVEIAGNTIGLALDADSILGNDGQGVRVEFGTNVVIGGAGAGNVISGNGTMGVMTGGADVLMQGNRIGTDGSGLSARGNGTQGIHAGGSGLVIGGDGAGEANIVGGNAGDGVQFSSGNLDASVVGNLIGVGADGTTPLGNFGRGIALFDSTSVVIGGDAVGTGNEIANNRSHGVIVTGTSDVALLGNSIHDNSGLGIDLEFDGVTINDPLDADAGANKLLNHPEISSAVESGGIVTLYGTFDVPAGDYRLEFFVNPSGADPSGYGEGETFVGSALLFHSGSGEEPFGAAFPGLVGDVVTATITEAAGGPTYGATSEFSPVVSVVAPDGARDSSGRQNDLAAGGGLDWVWIPPGIVGPGIDVRGGSERLIGTSTDLLSDEVTLSAWVRPDSLGTDPRVVAKAASDGNAIYELLIDGATTEAVARFDLGAGPVEVRGGSTTIGTWSHLAVTWDGAWVRLYVDGAEVDTVAATGTLTTDVLVPLVVGNLASADRGFDGQVDQVHVAHVARSAEWVATAHANRLDPGSFVTMGAAQTTAPGAWAVSGSIGRTGSHAVEAPETAADADAWLTAIGVDEPGVEISSWWRVSDPSAVEIATSTRTGSVPIDQNEAASSGAGFELATLVGGNRTSDATDPGMIPGNAWVQVTMRTDQLGVSTVLVDGVERLGPVAHIGGLASGSAGFRTGLLPPGESWFIDDARVRRLVSVEPTTSLGPLDRN